MEVSENPADNRDAGRKLNIRNEWMVEHTGLIFAVWDGSQKGGTANCVRYAQKHYKNIHALCPNTMQVTKY